MELNKIKEIIAEQLGTNIEELTEETRFQEDLNADSLDLFQIIMAIEEEAGIEIPTEDAETLQTVGDVKRYMESKKEEV